MAKYAEGTTVSAEKSRAEIDALLKKYGIEDVGIMSMRGQNVVMFQRGNVGYRMTIAQVDPTSREFTHTHHGYSRALVERQKKVAQEENRRWRALLLTLKAKLVATEDGIVSFEEEFLAYAIASDGKTIGEHVVPALEAGGSVDVTRLALPGGNSG